MAKAVYKVVRSGKSEWVHASTKGQTVKLRWFGPEYEDPQVLNISMPGDAAIWHEIRSGKRFDISAIAGLTNDFLSFSADELRVDVDSDRWAEVFERLQQLGEITPVNEDIAKTAQPLGDGPPIPQTRLRRFYEMMRMLNEARLQGDIAKYLTEKGRAKRIQVMFKESESHFARYANPNEAFHDRDKPDWLQDYANQPNAFAKCLVSRMRPNATFDPTLIEDGKSVRVIDYELSLFRTTGRAAFEDGKAGTSSGSGGMDLLLQDSETRIPVVGEIKAPTDRDLFLALVQALTYATELTTQNQLARLVRHYQDRNFCTATRSCDILLIYDKNGKPPKLMDETKQLATQLLDDPASPVARRIRKIAFVGADLSVEGGIALKCEWSTATR
jgi:hypothetical protein